MLATTQQNEKFEIGCGGYIYQQIPENWKACVKLEKKEENVRRLTIEGGRKGGSLIQAEMLEKGSSFAGGSHRRASRSDQRGRGNGYRQDETKHTAVRLWCKGRRIVKRREKGGQAARKRKGKKKWSNGC